MRTSHEGWWVVSNESHNRFDWAPVAAKPGQEEASRRLGAVILSPTGEAVNGQLVEATPHRRGRQGDWNWSVGIYRDWGVHFTRGGYAQTSQGASDLANAAVPEVIAEAAAHDESEVAIEAILEAARRPEGEWVIPSLPIADRDDRFLKSLQWRIGQGVREARRGPLWPGYVALAAALRKYLNR
jgi:hypothetical protein